MSRLFGRIVAAVCVAGSLSGCVAVPGSTFGYNAGPSILMPAMLRTVEGPGTGSYGLPISPAVETHITTVHHESVAL